MKTLPVVSAEEAVRVVRSGNHIHLGSVASVPHVLVQALCRRADAGEVRDLHFHHFHTEGPAPYSEERYSGIFFDQGFFIGGNVRANVNAGWADYLPVKLYESQRFYRNGTLPCDVAMVQVSRPERGKVSLGTSVDASLAAIEASTYAIAVINPNVPFAGGDLISVEAFDAFVEDDTPLYTTSYAAPTETDMAIGRHCAELVPDGACLQMGIGSLPNAIARELNGHKDPGIHSEMFADGVLELIRNGVINGRKKKTDRGKVVASFLLGSEEVYRFIDHNPLVKMKDIGYTNDPFVIAQNPRTVSINSALEIDLTGQVCADSIGTRMYSGAGGQLDFVRGARLAPEGKAIIALAARTNKGGAKIVPTLHPGAGVVTPRADIQWVVTEYGSVNLSGRSLQERAKLLISIAHPDDRDTLDRAAFERFGPHWNSLRI